MSTVYSTCSLSKREYSSMQRTRKKTPYMQACKVKTDIVGLVLKGWSVHECGLRHTYNGNESFVCCIATFPSHHVSLLLRVGESQWRGAEVTLALMCKRLFICECASLISTIVQAWLNTRSIKMKPASCKLSCDISHICHFSSSAGTRRLQYPECHRL